MLLMASLRQAWADLSASAVGGMPPGVQAKYIGPKVILRQNKRYVCTWDLGEGIRRSHLRVCHWVMSVLLKHNT